mgnify:CR=1 FL=1
MRSPRSLCSLLSSLSSLAASRLPTAVMPHMSPWLATHQPFAFESLEPRSLALHVGAGTFKPVSAPLVHMHSMHAERFSISVPELEALAASAAAGDC